MNYLIKLLTTWLYLCSEFQKEGNTFDVVVHSALSVGFSALELVNHMSIFS